jgi:hypothetical protein
LTGHILTDKYLITPDQDYAEEINTRVEFSEVLLTLIGKRWLSSKDVRGEQWLERKIRRMI